MMDDGKTYTGEVIWFNPKLGYGFISWKVSDEEMKDMFVHYSDLNMEGFRQLQAGEKVEFCVGKNNNGDPKAINVSIIK